MEYEAIDQSFEIKEDKLEVTKTVVSSRSKEEIEARLQSLRDSVETLNKEIAIEEDYLKQFDKK